MGIALVHGSGSNQVMWRVLNYERKRDSHRTNPNLKAILKTNYPQVSLRMGLRRSNVPRATGRMALSRHLNPRGLTLKGLRLMMQQLMRSSGTNNCAGFLGRHTLRAKWSE
jgi:hypothetical protein